MKTQSQKMLKAVKELARVQGQLKTLCIIEKDLKTEIRAYMGTERLLEADQFCILIETRNRTDLDKDAMMHDLGTEFFKKYQKRTEYETMSLKPLNKLQALGG